MRARRAAAVVVMGLVALVGVAGCGSGRGGNDSSSGSAQELGAKDLAPPAQAGMADTAAGREQGKPAAGAGSAGQPVPATQRDVVRTAQLSIEVDDVYDAARKAHDVGTRFGGFVADEKTNDRGASIELKVASKDLDAAMTALAELGSKVTGRNQQAQDVTEQVVDLQARLASQRTSVERIRALLNNATTIAEIVQVEAELTSRQADLESLEQRMAALSSQTELATVSVTMSRPGAGPIAEVDETGFLGGLHAGWRVFLASAEVLLTMLGALLPFLIALAIPVAVIVLVLRRRRPSTPTAPAAPPAPAA